MKAARLKDAGERSDLEAGMAKLFASEAGRFCVEESFRIHGGYGYSKEYEIERLYRDAPLLLIGEGTSEIQRMVIGKKLLDLVLLRVAVAAVDAEGLLDAEPPGLGGEELGHARLEVRARAGVLEPRGADRQQAGGVDLGRHVGELELDRLVLGDRAAEGLALL